MASIFLQCRKINAIKSLSTFANASAAGEKGDGSTKDPLR